MALSCQQSAPILIPAGGTPERLVLVVQLQERGADMGNVLVIAVSQGRTPARAMEDNAAGQAIS